MNISNRQRLTESAIISAIGVIFAIGAMYIPFLSLLGIFVAVPYIIITTRNGIKYGFLSIFASFFMILISTEPIYSLTMLLLLFIPGVFIGYRISKSDNPFDPISWGFISSIISTMIFIKIAQILIGINVIDQLLGIIKQSLDVQNSLIQQFKLPSEKLDVKSIIEAMSIVLPGLIIAQSIISSFLSYYIAVAMLRRIKGYNKELPKFMEFSLPGNIILGIGIIYLLAFVLRYIPGIYHETLMINIEIVFMFIFFLQGLAVYSYFLEKVKMGSRAKKTFIIFAILIGPISMMISLLGIVDAIIDFRKIRR